MQFEKKNAKGQQSGQLTIPHGLRYQSVSGKEGHCLYHAVALYLGGDQADLRRIVAARLEQGSDRAELRTFLQGQLAQGQTVNQYIAGVRAGREWADNVEIEVLMRVLGRPIAVVLPDGSLCNPEVVLRFATPNPIFVRYNGHTHYDALLLQEGADGAAILRRLGTISVNASRAAPGDEKSKTEYVVPLTISFQNLQQDVSAVRAKRTSVLTTQRLQAQLTATLKNIHSEVRQLNQWLTSGVPRHHRSILESIDTIQGFLHTIESVKPQLARGKATIETIVRTLRDPLIDLEKKIRPTLHRSASALQAIMNTTKQLYVGQALVAGDEKLHTSLNTLLSRVSQRFDDPPPTCFISYAWPTEANRAQEDWIQPFLTRLHSHLTQAGVRPLLDIVDNRVGAPITAFAKQAEKSSVVLLICSESLLAKHEVPNWKVVKTELQHIKRKHDRDMDVYGRSRVFPLLLSGTHETAYPVEYREYSTVRDMRQASYLVSLQRLISWIGEWEKDKAYADLWANFFRAFPMAQQSPNAAVVQQYHQQRQGEAAYKALQASKRYQTILAEMHAGHGNSSSRDADEKVPVAPSQSIHYKDHAIPLTPYEGSVLRTCSKSLY